MIMSAEDIQNLINYTQGTCKSLDQCCNEVYDHDTWDYENELEICNGIDNAIFECAQCGWWFECGYWNTDIGEQTSENVCLDCEPQEY